MVARRALAAAAVVAAVVAALAGASPAGAAPGALRVLLDGHLNVTGVDGNMTMSMNATADSGWADYTDDGSGDDGVSDGGDAGGGGGSGGGTRCGAACNSVPRRSVATVSTGECNVVVARRISLGT